MRKIGAVWILSLLVLFSCVTVNIYFPAQDAQKKAKKIVNDIRGIINNKKEMPPTSFRIKIFIRDANAASNVLNATNEKIKAIKQSMKKRFGYMKRYYQAGYVAEMLNGYVKLYKTPKSLRDKITLKKLIKKENMDRAMLYKEVAKILKIEPSQIGRLQKIFAKQWQDTAPKGSYIQTQTGWIRK